MVLPCLGSFLTVLYLAGCRLLWIKLDGTSGGERRMRLVELMRGCVRDKKVGGLLLVSSSLPALCSLSSAGSRQVERLRAQAGSGVEASGKERPLGHFTAPQQAAAQAGRPLFTPADHNRALV